MAVAHPANDFGGRAQGKMRGQLIGSPQQASLFINMPSPPPQVARVHLNVDGYPRAFIYDIACNEPSNDVPELKSLMSVQIEGAAKGRTINTGLMGAADAIDLSLKIDAPIGSFEHRIGGVDQPADEVELGLDLEKTGLLTILPRISPASLNKPSLLINTGLPRR